MPKDLKEHPMPMSQRCGYCWWWVPDNGPKSKQGVCHFNAPVPNGSTGLAKKGRQDFCSQFTQNKMERLDIDWEFMESHQPYD